MLANRVPNVLVLGVGGLVGEAWMAGFLAGIEQRTGVDLRHADAYVGTSAGSIVAATLAAGVSPRRPHQADAAPAHGHATRRLDVALRRARRSSLEAAYPFASLAIDAAEPAIALARAGREVIAGTARDPPSIGHPSHHNGAKVG
jgi:NTE family protein